MEDDLELLEAWRSGDTAAGNELFERHFPSIVRFVKNKLSERQELEDVVQQIFLACVEGRDRFAGRSSFRTYLFAVAHYTLMEHFRARRRGGPKLDTSMTSVADLGPSPSMVAAEREEQQLVVDALRRIPLDYQIALELFYWERLTGPEIAEILGVPEGTVRFRVRRGKELLGKKVRQLALTGTVAQGDPDELQAWVESLRKAVDGR